MTRTRSVARSIRSQTLQAGRAFKRPPAEPSDATAPLPTPSIRAIGIDHPHETRPGASATEPSIWAPFLPAVLPGAVSANCCRRSRPLRPDAFGFGVRHAASHGAGRNVAVDGRAGLKAAREGAATTSSSQVNSIHEGDRPWTVRHRHESVARPSTPRARRAAPWTIGAECDQSISSSASISMSRPSCPVPSGPRSYWRITPTGRNPTLM